jgi:hypothetical protein
MTPIVRQLKSWQAREWLFSACVAAASVVLLAGVGVTLACLIDYVWDGFGETPFWARVLLLALQLAAYAGFAVLAFRLVRTPSLVALAGRAEKAFTDFDHRLVTALQLNRPHARTAGMSKQLITAVTEEAIDETKRRQLASLTDPKRLLVAGGLLLPVLLIAAVAFVFFGPLAAALLQRQALLNAEIPRSVSIENATAPLFPAGDPVQVRLKVTSEYPLTDATTGTVSVTPAAGKGEQYELKNAGRQEDGSYLFTADLPPATESFTFTARVKDGRMRQPAEVTFEARPVVTEVAAWVLAPAYVDPEGKRRYEKVAPQGEVVCHPDCSVRVRAVASKPLTRAEVVLVGVQTTEEKDIVLRPDGVAVAVPRAVKSEVTVRVPLALEPGGTAGSATFGVPPGFNGYRVEVADEHGFANLAPPRRGISLLPDRPPTVTLNDELLMPGWETGPPDDYEVRGMPLIQGGQIQIGYLAKSSLGIARAAILYRVNDGPWTPFPLGRVEVDETKVGRFRQELGVFETYDVGRNVEFYPLPSLDPDAEPGGLVAGGRYNFETAALLKTGKDGKTSKLEVGDRVEFRVAVYDRKHVAVEKGLAVVADLLKLTAGRNQDALAAKVQEFNALPLPETPALTAARSAVAADPKTAGDALRALQAALQPDRPIPMTDTDTASRPADERVGQGRPAGYSESRLKAVVTEAAFQQWRDQQARSRERLREIEKLQQGVFGGGKGKD